MFGIRKFSNRTFFQYLFGFRWYLKERFVCIEMRPVTDFN